MKYRKKPIVIEAEQWLGQEIDGLVWREFIPEGDRPLRALGIQTLEGFMEVRHGDWIITGVKGEKYPCKDNIFQMTYEPT